MKRLITFLLLLAATCANAQVIYYWEDSQFVGNLKTNVNKSFSNVVAAIAGISSGGAQSPFTNDLDAAGNSIENLDAPEITNTTVFIRLWGTNVLSLQGTTNVALNNVSLMDGPSDGNTPQGPWTNVVSMNAFAATGGDYVQVTNQIAFRVGTNLLAVQGWPDATNIAWNGAALINVSGGGSGGAFAQDAALNIISTNVSFGTNLIAGSFVATPNDSPTLFRTSNDVVIGQGLFIDSGHGHVNIGTSNSIDAAAQLFSYATIGGGRGNAITDAFDSVIGGGSYNSMKNSNGRNVIGGGTYNVCDGYDSVIGGGGSGSTAAGNKIEAGNNECVIGGGAYNRISNTTARAVIGGGYNNQVAFGATAAGIGGGFGNKLGKLSTYSWIVGGNTNIIGTNATGSVVLGGIGNEVANNAQYAVAAGRGAQASHAGTFVFSDSQDGPFASTAANTFNVRAAGGVYLKSGTMSTAVRQPLYLGAYTNVNPTTIIPTMQMDWYYDAGSNYILRTTDGTTNGWAHLQ